ncbi:choice-of-anchor I family protein [Myxosarcina sp. GI1(2024)]
MTKTNNINLSPLGRYATGVFDEGAAEIPAYDSETQRLFVVNGNEGTVDVLDLSDPSNPTLIKAINITPFGASPNSVAAKDGIVAVAIAAEETQDPGKVAFFSTNGDLVSQVTVGALPDMVTFTPDGKKVLVANEGEPSDDYTNDPEGSISIIDLSGGVENLRDTDVTTAGFADFNDRKQALTEAGVRIFGPDVSTENPDDTVTVAQDLEPEYIAVTPDSETAFVTLQENNALAKVDIRTAEVTEILPLGFKNYSNNALDPSDEDGAINLRNAPVLGMYQPDAIAAYKADDGETYIVTANEGDAREYIVEGEAGNETETFVEESRIADLKLDPEAFPNAAELQQEENLGRLLVTTTRGDTDGDGDYDELYAFGGRSFSIWDSEGNLVFDSGSELERITAEQFPDFFNSDNDENSFDTRSDNKGPEPEGVALGTIGDRNYAFVGLERIGGIMVYDITEPSSAEFVQYINTRDFEGDLEAGTAGNVAPEGLEFIPAAESPTGMPLLAVAYEVSGSTAVFELTTSINPNQGEGEMSPVTGSDPDSETGSQPMDEERYRLQLLHTSDLEGGVDAIQNAPNFAASVDFLEEEVANSLTISAGDNYIPGPFFSAAGDESLVEPLQNAYKDFYDLPEDALSRLEEGVGRVDISIMNFTGFDASAIGNHEFDLGPDTMADIIAPTVDDSDDDGTPDELNWLGAQFPYLSTNLDFTNSALEDLVAEGISENTAFQSSPPFEDLDASGSAGTRSPIANTPKLAPATVIERGGEQIGVVGITTPLLASISSPREVEVVGPDTNDLQALAEVIQPTIDELLSQGINKIVLTSHLQQIALEQDLAPLLSGVDIIIAGGSDTILADETDTLRSGDTAADTYPIFVENADGEPVAIVSSAGEYSYVGRLVVDFDENGVVIPESVDPEVSGAYATTDEIVASLWGSLDEAFADETRGEVVRQVTDAVENVVNTKDSNVFGLTEVFLDGRREEVRTQETNLGNLTADANLFYADFYDDEVAVSIKNGGGIRAPIGQVVNEGNETQFLSPQANPASGKDEGEISQLDIENTLRFNNELSLLTVTAEELEQIVEYAVSATEAGATPGQFPQIGGFAFSFDPDAQAIAIDEEGNVTTEGERVQSLSITDEEGVTDIIVEDGELVGDPSREIRLVTLNFLADGGDGYPFPAFGENRVDLPPQPLPDAAPNEAEFAEPGTEQDTLAEYLAVNFPADDDPSTPAFDNEDTPPEEDTRIQNLLFRDDTVLDSSSNGSNGDGGVVVDNVPVIDLTGIEDAANISLTVSRDAFFENTVGLFEVTDTDGTVIDPISGEAITPGDAGYLDAALANSLDLSLSVPENNQQAEFTAELAGGTIYAPFLVVDGDIEELTDSNSSNEPTVYFSYKTANSDEFSHIRVIGENTYGFEDIFNGGDRDFNDIIVEFDLA